MKVDSIELSTLVVISFLVSFLELITNIDHNIKVIGITGQLFYFYFIGIIFALFATAMYYKRMQSNKNYSYRLVGSILAVIGSVLNLMIIISHFLLKYPPISDSNYANWSIFDDFSFILIIGMLSVNFLLKEYKSQKTI